MARGDSLSRQLQLWMLLDRERSLSVEDVCSRLSIRRTLYRDLEVLQHCAMPLWQEQQGRRVRWRLDDGFKRTLQVNLSVQEAMAIVAAERLLSSMAGTIFSSAASTAVTKLKAQLAKPIQERLERLASSLRRNVIDDGPDSRGSRRPSTTQAFPGAVRPDAVRR